MAAQPSASLAEVAGLAGVSYATAFRHLHGRVKSPNAPGIDAALAAVAYRPGYLGRVLPTRAALNLPDELDETLAWFLGYFVGDGNLNKSGIGLTTGDEELARRLCEVVGSTFGLRATVKLDVSGGHSRWRVVVHSRELWRLLESVGIDLDARARSKNIPALVLRSPKSVMSAFLRGYFDADAYAGPEGIRLSSSSAELIRTVQIVLLNYGILSRQRRHPHDIMQLEISGASARAFLNEIGFSLERKQRALREYVAGHRWLRKEEIGGRGRLRRARGWPTFTTSRWTSEHAYVANGFVNHNSFWHARIMRELDLPDEEHAGVCGAAFGRRLAAQGAVQSVLPRLQNLRGHRAALGQPFGRGAREVRARGRRRAREDFRGARTR